MRTIPKFTLALGALIGSLVFAARPAAAAASISPTSVNLTAGGNQLFTLSPSSVTITSFTVNNAVVSCYQPADSTNLLRCVAPSSIFATTIVTLTVVTDQGTVTATITLVPTVSVAISPTSATLYAGQSQQFTATVSGVTSTGNSNVTWSVTTSTSGASTGTVTQSGLYTAPSDFTARYTVTVTATSVADPTKSASATVTLMPAAVSISPTSVSLNAGGSQQFTATVSYATDTRVTWSIDPAVGTVDQNGFYTAPSSISAQTKVTITATSVADPTKTASATITIQAVAIVVTPTTVSLAAGETQLFTATVRGATDTSVTWSITPNLGKIDQTGFYTAPDTVLSRTTVTVIATSVADPTRTGTATITLTSSSMTVSPSSVTLYAGNSQQFTVSVTVGTAPDVYWKISPAVGSISSSGLYTAPSVVSSKTTVTVTATAVNDTTRTATATITLATVTGPGHGAPSAVISGFFVSAFYRNGFNMLVDLPPLTDVKKYGAGLIQTFSAASPGSGTYALIDPNTSNDLPIGESSYPVYQVYSDIYSVYSGIGYSTAGYPTMDTASCPAFSSTNTCTYQLFSNNYAIFAYKLAVNGETSYTIASTFYTKWASLYGLNGPGRPISAQTSITSAKTSVTATMQTYSNGAIFSITSGAQSGSMYAVTGAIYTAYIGKGGYSGTLGLPTSAEVTTSAGLHRQSFEGGTLEYMGADDPTLKLAVSSVALSGATAGGTVKMNYGESITLTAVATAATGGTLTGRVFTWSTTNGQVLSITTAGSVAVIKAIGGGTASVSVTCEGVTSSTVTFVVTAPCCKVGEGAPSAAIQQYFQDAVTRNGLKVAYPASSSVTRSGGGYVQLVQSADGTVSYLLAKSDKSATTYVVSGAILKRYQELGGVTGVLGYPSGDATSGGRQLFENGYALAGSPVCLVAGQILAKWAAYGYETGIVGSPIGEASSPVLTFGANTVTGQPFTGGSIFAALSGPRVSQAYFVKGLILARYMALSGLAGSFGMPTGDETVSGAAHSQKFEGGSIGYNEGDAEAKEQASARQPTVVAVPSTANAGSRVRLAVYGFSDNATLRISATGQTDFQVATSNGAYTWEVYVPLTATSGTVAVQAAETAGSNKASGSYTVKGLSENRATLSRVQGDSQTGVPGALLPVALRVMLKDSSGAGIGGVPVTFTASPGAKVTVSSAVTDSGGLAETRLRLPSSEGVALVSVDAAGVAQAPVTFSARAVPSSLSNFPALMATGETRLGAGSSTFVQKGALLAAAAGILRYHQNRGELGTPNGQADLATLNKFLTSYCTSDSAGNKLCDGFLSPTSGGEQIVNLWRAAEFTGGVDVTVLPPDAASIADALAQGSPVLLSLAITAEDAPAGGHFVVATGVSSDGGILIHDPSKEFARTSLSDYLNGFPLGNYHWKGELKGAVQFALSTPSARRFLLASVSQPQAVASAMAFDAASVAGTCGPALELWNQLLTASPTLTGVSRFRVCQGSDSLYQLSVGASQPYQASVTDLASNGGGVVDLSGSAAAMYQVTRPVLAFKVSTLAATFEASSVVNGATYTPGIAPGGLMAIFGAGFGSGAAGPTVTVDGKAAKVVSSTSFQINAQVPADVAAGAHTLEVTSAFGAARQSIGVSAVAPAIFLANTAGTQGTVFNQDYKLNSASNPISRGRTLLVYCTGLGAVTLRGGLSWTAATVTAVINGVELPVSFSGLAGYTGVYQVNIPVPANLAPGLDLPLQLKAGGVLSNTVSVSIQ